MIEPAAPAQGEAVIKVDRVSRAYGHVVALNDLSLEIRPGLVGLLGPNGAGKSTLIKLVTGELRPTLGTVRVLGLDPYANPDVYHRMGYCPEQEAVFDDLTGREFVSFMLRLRGWDPAEAGKRARDWIARLGLEDAIDRRLAGYSKGMRQRCKLATAFAHSPDLLLLDEPLTGLDPLWRHRVILHMREIVAHGATVLFSSHVLHEVEQATPEIVLLYRGRLYAQGDAREIRALVDSVPHRIHIESREPRKLALRLLSWDCVASAGVGNGVVDVMTPQPEAFYARLTAEASDADLGIEGFTSPDHSLQALFEALVA